jgi:hypothetical protein
MPNKLKDLLKDFTFTAMYFDCEDGSVTATLSEVDIVVDGKDNINATNLLVDDLIEYSTEYINDFFYWYNSSNRKQHLPYVLNVLLQDNKEDIKRLING